MKFTNKILISCVTASILATVGYAQVIDTATTGYIVIDTDNDTLEITSSGSITNTSATSAIIVDDGVSGVQIQNDGVIDSSDDDFYIYGIKVYDTPGISIVNGSDGVIDVVEHTPDKYATGIYAEVLNADSTIENQGTIEVSGSVDDVAIDIVTSLNGIITNSGSIVSDGTGIRFDSGSGTLLNSGTIESDYYTILNTGSFSGDFSNSGTLSTGSVEFDVLSVDGTISNSGTITTSTKEAVKISTLDGTLSNSGTIYSSDSSGILIMDGGSGTITNTSTGVIEAQNAINTTGNAVDGFIGSIDNAGVMTTELIYAPSASFTNSGRINLSGSSVSELSTYTQTADGILSIGLVIAADGNSATYSKIKTTGSIVLEDGSTIDVDVTGNGAESLWEDNVGSVSDILETTNSTITASVDTLNITDNSALLSFYAELNSDSTKLSLVTKQAQTVTQSVESSDIQNSFIIEAASIFDNVQTGVDSDIDEFINNLNKLETNEQVAEAIDETLPNVANTTSNVNSQVVTAISSVVQTRQSSVRGLSSGDEAFTNKNIWFKPFGSRANQKDKDNINGFNADSYGFGIGVDGEYSGANRIGVALFYTNVDVDTNNVTQSNEMDIASLVVYGSNPIIDDKTSVDYQVGFSLQYSDSSRYISTTSQTATASYTAKNFYTQAKVMREIYRDSSWRIIPAFKGAYRYLYSPSYSESGAGGLNLDIQSFDTEAFIVGAESTFIYSYNEKTNLQVNLGVDYDLINDDNSVISGYQGTPDVSFKTNGIKNSPTILQAGVGLEHVLTEDLDFSMNYDFSSRGNYFTNYTLAAKLNYKF